MAIMMNTETMPFFINTPNNFRMCLGQFAYYKKDCVHLMFLQQIK